MIILKLKEYLQKIDDIHIDLFNPWEHKFQHYDIIHHFSLHSWELWNHYKFFNKKLVVTPTFWSPNSKLYTLKYHLKYRLKQLWHRTPSPICLSSAMKLPDAFLPTTSIEQKKIQRLFSLKHEHRFHVIPNGITPCSIPTQESNAFVKKYGLEKYALYVGTIAPNKNVHKIIIACKKLNLPLCIIGAAPPFHHKYYSYCQSIADKKVLFTGHIDNNSSLLASAYINASVLVVASEFETCSLTGLEAGSVGTPVAITQFGGTREIYQDHVQYLNPHSISSIIDAIQRSLARPFPDHALQQHILPQYSWEHIAQRVARIYKNLLN